MVYQKMALLLRDVAILFPAFLLVFTFRGFFRALIARWMGDDTAARHGFLSFNPLVHVDIIGLMFLLVMVFFLGAALGRLPQDFLYILLIIVGVRWTYCIPFEARNFKNFKLGMILTLIAGPLGCFLLSLISMYAIKYVPFYLLSMGAAKSFYEIIVSVINLSVYFGVLSLIPIPPFDGGRLLQFLLPYSKQKYMSWLEEYSLFIILIIFFLPGISDLFLKGIWTICQMIKILLLKLVI